MISQRPSLFQSFGRLFKILLGLTGLVALAGFAISLYVYFFFARNLPDLSNITNYNPPVISEVYAIDNAKIGEFWTQDRLVLPYKKIPQRVIDAFLASEDIRFFKHPGVDFRSIARAFFKNLRAGKVVQGGSTITQQVARSLLLTRSRTYERKIKEAILATQIEQHLNKEEILYLYLNQLYLGNRAYGIQAAALNYFQKPVNELNLAEIAMIAGLPSAPAAFSPLNNPTATKERQKVVLERMVEAELVTLEQAKKAIKTTLKIYRAPTDKEFNARYAPYFTEHVRRLVAEQYGHDILNTGGLKIHTTVNMRAQRAAQQALQKGLRVVDKRQGFRGPIEKIATAEWDKFSEELHNTIISEEEDYFFIPPAPKSTHPTTPLKPNKLYKALILQVERDRTATIRIGHATGQISPAGHKWTSRKLQPGWVVWVQMKEETGEEGETARRFLLEQKPRVEGALYSMRPQTGEVIALVGGYDFKRSEFNRAVQAFRQPGSAFKPIIYSAALDKGYTSQTTIADAPVTYQVGERSFWSPQNYGRKFKGPMALISALTHSVNVIAVKIFHDIGIDYVIAYAHKMGIGSEIRPYLSSSLGASDVHLSEMVRAYSVFPALGIRPTPTAILKIVDKNGEILQKKVPLEPAKHKKVTLSLQEEDQLNAKLMAEQAPFIEEKELELTPGELKVLYGARIPEGHVITPQTAFIMTRLMKNIVDHGTGYRAHVINKPAGGKTGTTNDETDAWFIGYTANVCTGAWVGFDVKKRLGRAMTGGVISAPIWADYMEEFLKDIEATPLPVPPDVSPGKFASMTGGSALFDQIREELVDEGVEVPEGITPSKATDFLFEDVEELEDVGALIEETNEPTPPTP